tara:strand:- start:9917 stop:10063 length:147 start_codon:yes stop_codon:yes gene_type:complete
VLPPKIKSPLVKSVDTSPVSPDVAEDDIEGRDVAGFADGPKEGIIITS